jgi:hypothetical protein
MKNICTEYESQKWYTPTDAIPVLALDLQSISAENGLEALLALTE